MNRFKNLDKRFIDSAYLFEMAVSRDKFGK